MTKFIGIIPARYASSRFPGKPLIDINGKSMIQRVYEQVSRHISHVIVATDNKRIEQAVLSFGGKVVMTSAKHKSGTDRCAEALSKYTIDSGYNPDVVINIQGDEPFIKAEHLTQIISCFNDETTEIATLAKLIESKDELFNKNQPKVIFNKFGKAIYFSRLPIPFLQGINEDNWHRQHNYYKHIGIYAYRTNVLNKITKLESTNLEKAESLEQLRWIENAYKIQVAITDVESQSIDTPADLAKILSQLKNK